MLTVITLLKIKPSPDGEKHGERPFWRKHGERYLEQWLSRVMDFVSSPRNIIVMTDSDRLLESRWDGRVAYAPLDATVDAPGFWAKLHMFKYGQGKCLYLDLDNVINGPLDDLCALEPDPLIMLDDRRVPGLPNGSAILFDAEKCRDIWDWYATTPRHWEQEYVADGDNYWHAYDQAFIADWFEDNNTVGAEDVPLFQDFLPEGYTLNARSELPNATDWQNARLIFGCGSTKPHTSTHPAFSLR